jgi:hypothetical protein
MYLILTFANIDSGTVAGSHGGLFCLQALAHYLLSHQPVITIVWALRQIVKQKQSVFVVVL